MITRRILIPSKPDGAFIYALHDPNATQSIQIGVGHESKSGLQLSHIMTMNLKPGFAYEIADQIEREGFVLKTGRLAPMFDGSTTLTLAHDTAVVHSYDQDDGTTKTVIDKPLKVLLAQAIREVHDAVWGNPRDWDVQITALGDGRCLWAAYDSTIDKIRLGIGFFNEAGESDDYTLGDQSFSVGRRFAGDFAVDCFSQPNAMIFYARPPRWPQHLSHVVGHTGKQKLAKLFLKLADEVWPGEVKTTGRRVLTDEEREALSPGH